MVVIRVTHTHPGITDSILGPGWDDEGQAIRALVEAGWKPDWGNHKKTHPRGWEMIARPEKLRNITDL